MARNLATCQKKGREEDTCWLSNTEANTAGFRKLALQMFSRDMHIKKDRLQLNQKSWPLSRTVFFIQLAVTVLDERNRIAVNIGVATY